MAASTVLLLVVATLCGCALADFSDLSACKYTDDNGKTYDLSPLSKGGEGYLINVTGYTTQGNIISTTAYADPANVQVQFEICKNITKPVNPTCNVTAPAYMYDPSQKSCVALGKLYVATFEPNPFKDGVHLNYYFGDAVTHIMRYKCKIYFVCDQTTELGGPDFEHLKDNYDAHIHIKTKHAC